MPRANNICFCHLLQTIALSCFGYKGLLSIHACNVYDPINEPLVQPLRNRVERNERSIGFSTSGRDTDHLDSARYFTFLKTDPFDALKIQEEVELTMILNDKSKIHPLWVTFFLFFSSLFVFKFYHLSLISILSI